MTFPPTIAPFIDKIDFEDYVLAAHINTLQNEVVSTQTALGTSILIADYGATAWVAPATAYTSLSARINNIERGLINGVPTSPYLPRTGGALSPASGSVGLSVTSAVGTSADLLQTKNSSLSTKFRVDSTGQPFVDAKAVLYVDSTEYAAIYSAIAAVASEIPAGSINPLLLSGM